MGSEEERLKSLNIVRLRCRAQHACLDKRQAVLRIVRRRQAWRRRPLRVIAGWLCPEARVRTRRAPEPGGVRCYCPGARLREGWPRRSSLTEDGAERRKVK